MKNILSIAASLLLATVVFAGDYTLVWNEDFTDGALDTNVWNIEVNGDGGGNNELQYYCEKGVSIERYAWFMPRSAKRQNYELLTHDVQPALTDLGRVYCGFSSFDKSVSLSLSKPVYGNQYVGVSSDNIVVKPTNEDQEHLMVCLNEGDWTEYQVYAEQSKPLSIHYSTAVNSKITISVDGRVSEEIDLSKTGYNEWATYECSSLRAGKHTVRIEVNLCGINFGWMTQQ